MRRGPSRRQVRAFTRTAMAAGAEILAVRMEMSMASHEFGIATLRLPRLCGSPTRDISHHGLGGFIADPPIERATRRSADDRRQPEQPKLRQRPATHEER